MWYFNAVRSFNASDCRLDPVNGTVDQNSISSLKCANAPGVGVNYNFVVEVDGIQSEVSGTRQRLSYDTPTLTGFSGPNGTEARELDTRGGEVIWILGRNFGNNTAYLDSIFHRAPFNTSQLFVPSSCNASDNEKIVCLTAPGAGEGHEWNVTVGGQVRVTQCVLQLECMCVFGSSYCGF